MPTTAEVATPSANRKRQLAPPAQSIRARLLVMLGGTLLITLVLIALSLYTLSRTIEHTSWQERQTAATHLAERQIRAFVAQAERSMKFITNNLRAITLAGRFLELTNAHPAFMELIILDAAGQTLVHSTRTTTHEFDQDISQTRWFQQTRNAAPNLLYIDDIKFSKQNEPYILIALRAESGEIIAVAVSLAFVSEILEFVRFGETGQAYLVAGSGAIVAHTDPNVVNARVSLSGRPELPQFEYENFVADIYMADTPLMLQEQQYTNFQGAPVCGTIAMIAGTDWIIFTEVAESEVFAASGQLLLPLIGFASVFWGGAMLMTSWVIGNLIFAPLARLRAGQQAIADGNLETVVVANRRDEMGLVIAGFNAMTRELQQRIQERQATQVTLDQTQHQMRQAADSLNGAIYQFSGNEAGYKLDYISDGIEKLCGLSAATLMNDADLTLQVLHPEDKKPFIKALTDVFQTMSTNWVFEGRLIHARNGDVRWFRAEAKLQKLNVNGIVFKGVVLDITERKRFENALRLNSKAIEASPVGIVIADAQQADMPLVYVNPMFEIMTGYTAYDVLGSNCRFLQGNDQQQPAIQTLNDAIQKGEETTVILRNYRKNGTMFWNELSVSPIYDMEGVITHYLGIQNDITERRLAEEKLNALYQTIARSTITLDEKLSEVLRIGAQIFGFEVGVISQIEGNVYTILYSYAATDAPQPGQIFDFEHTYCDLTYAADDMVVISHMQRSEYRRHPCYAAYGLEAYIGVPLHIHGQRFGTLNFSSTQPRLTPFTTADREFFSLMAQWVSTKLEQKLTENALRESEANLRSILDNTPAVITRTTPDLKIEFLRMPGAAPSLLDTMVGENFIYFLPQSYHVFIHEIVQQVVAKRETLQYQIESFDPRDGKKHWYSTNVAPIIADDQVVSLLFVSTDITERKLAEQQIEAQNQSLVKTNHDLAIARQEAEAASQLKSQFLATMSHELRTPLNAIIGYTQLQLAGITGDLTPEQNEFQERILANSQHLLHLINEVLDLSKIEAGGIELVKALFNLHYALQEIVTQNNVLAAKKGVSLRLEIADDLPEMVIGDRGRIKQIFINLVSNAIKFTDVGSITIAAARHDETTYRVAVTDTGIGIAAHKQEIIFEEFRQLENHIERGGTGLGLPIARKLARMMGGDIVVTSELGQGSCFTVLLPLGHNQLSETK